MPCNTMRPRTVENVDMAFEQLRDAKLFCHFMMKKAWSGEMSFGPLKKNWTKWAKRSKLLFAPGAGPATVVTTQLIAWPN